MSDIYIFINGYATVSKCLWGSYYGELYMKYRVLFSNGEEVTCLAKNAKDAFYKAKRMLAKEGINTSNLFLHNTRIIKL